MRGTTPNAYQRNPQYWAKALREKVSPFTLQCEIVQIILFDYDAGWAFSAFEEWTGDPKGWGPPIKCIHSEEEIRGALDAIGYGKKRNIAMGTDFEDGGFRLGEAPLPASNYKRLWAFIDKEVDRGYRAFWAKRGEYPPEVSRNTIS